MLFEGVSFNVELCSAMTQKEFVSLHAKTLWKDRNEKERKQMLVDAYRAITGKTEEPEAPEPTADDGASE